MLINLQETIQKYNLDIKGVIHLGANEGQERDVYNSLNVSVLWVEAIPEVFEKLYWNISGYPMQRAINACIGKINGEEKIFHISNNEAQSSSYLPLGTHKTAHPEVHYIDHVAMSTIRVDTLIDSVKDNFGETPFEINEQWLLMADLQGSEMDALISCGELLDKFGAVYLEVNEQPLYEGCALKHEIEDFLGGYGFTPVEEFMYKQWGWGDEFFINNSLIA
jgi:hypothetical protein